MKSHHTPLSLPRRRIIAASARAVRHRGDDALSVVSPGGITFPSGVTYQLWLLGRNAKGQGEAGPVTGWVVP